MQFLLQGSGEPLQVGDTRQEGDHTIFLLAGTIEPLGGRNSQFSCARTWSPAASTRRNGRETMRTIIAITQVTLDGVMQAPGGPEEDPRNGFTHGGWAMPFGDDALSQAIGETIAGAFDMLLGRRTYEIFAAYWPYQGDNPIAKAFN